MHCISPRDLKALIDQDRRPTVIDVRTPLEFEEVHVAEARNFPLDCLNPTSLMQSATLPADSSIYILCRSGKRATKAYTQFLSLGYENVVVVEGGTLAWIEAGLPVERSEVKVISLDRQVRIAAGFVVLSGVILGWQTHPAFYGLSGLVGAGLIFAGITDWCGMGLLIAKAPWNHRAAKP